MTINTLNFAAAQDAINTEDNVTMSPALLAELETWNSQLNRLRGDNIYDVARLFWSSKGQHSLQLELEIDIPHGATAGESAEQVTHTVINEVLKPIGARLVRTLMGRLVIQGDNIIGALVNPSVSSTKATYDILGLPVFCDWFKGEWKTKLANNPTPYLTRVRMSGDGSLSGVVETIPPVAPLDDISVFYPFLDMTPAETWEAFKKSNANILLLIGPPGTGKSNFILNMMNARGWDDKVNLVDREDILMNPGLADWIRDRPSGSVVITEDSDKMVGKRTDGNPVMSAILNTTAGIVSRDVKIIISTNLPTIKDVDAALVRPGRCFKILTFKEMTSAQGYDVRRMMGMDLDVDLGEDRKDVTLAEAINKHEAPVTRKAAGIGFSSQPM